MIRRNPQDPVSIIPEELNPGDSQDDVCSGDAPLPSAIPGLLGIPAALMAAAWCCLDRLYQPPKPGLAIVLGTLGLIFLLKPILKRPRPHSVLSALVIGLLSFLWLASVDRALVVVETRASSLEVLAQAVAPLVSMAGYGAAAEAGGLRVDHPEGLVTILPSMEKIGVRPLVRLGILWLLLFIALDRRRLIDVAAAGLLTLVFVAFIRFTACVFVYVEFNKVLLPDSGFSALSVFSGAVVNTLTILVSGVALDAVSRRILAKVPSVSHRLLPGRLIAFFVGGSVAAGLLVGFTASFEPPGRQKSGRVLFDDRFCGVWEPTARLLDTEWYGDFSTYSFGSLAEWLGHWYSVDANATQTYNDELLSRYDILVLKTPTRRIPDPERDAIDRFVRRGGGLLLVGDHTNLLGMGTHLNSLCAKYGLRFRYDSVSDATDGGFVNYYGRSVGRHVAALHVDHLQFMTSCSLELDSRAEAIITAESCRRDPADYANSSFFGRSGPHPELPHGSMVLAASTRAGRGRIVAFTDSTVWSSFAVFRFDREKLAADMIGILNREPSTLLGPLRWIAVLGVAVSILAVVNWVRAGAAGPVFLGWLLGFWCGMALADEIHRVLYDPGPPRGSLNEVAFLWKGGSCAFPAALGNTGSLPLDRAFDTLFISTQRLGLVPRVAYTYHGDLFTPRTRAIFVIAPVDRPPQSVLARIKLFVQRGGSLVVLDDGSLGGKGSAGSYMRTFGIGLRYTVTHGARGEHLVHSSLSGLTEMKNVPAPDTFVGHRAFGAGHVIYMRESTQFSRIGLGHCFARPGRLARARYETIFWLFREIVHLAGERRYYGICD